MQLQSPDECMRIKYGAGIKYRDLWALLMRKGTRRAICGRHVLQGPQKIQQLGPGAHEPAAVAAAVDTSFHS